MSDKKLDFGGLVNNGLGHPLARALAEGLWKTQLIRRFAAVNPEMMSFISKGVMAVTSLLEVGGDHPIARFGNYLAETLATENLELLKQFQKNPDDTELAEKVELFKQFQENPDDPEIARKMAARVDATIKKAQEDVYVALHHIHKDEKCLVLVDYLADATPPARVGKDGKSFSNPSAARIRGPLPLENALAVTTALCSKCYPPALSVGKAEEKQDKSKEVVPGRNFMEYVMRYKADHGDDGKYLQFWRTYMARLTDPDGPDLARKFQEAFNGKHSYEAFCFVADLPAREKEHGWEEWHHALDALLGKVTAPESMRKSIEGFIKDEKRQTEEMFLKLFAWIEKATAASKVRTAEKKAANDKRDEEWKAFLAARKARKLRGRIVFFGLLVILASWFAINRVTDAPASPEKSEQKVETSNVR